MIIKKPWVCMYVLAYLASIGVTGQTTDELLQTKYWNYKNRLQKYFIYYAPTNVLTSGGTSTPCYQHSIGKYGLQALCSGQNLSGHIKQGDAPEAIGMYMAALAL